MMNLAEKSIQFTSDHKVIAEMCAGPLGLLVIQDIRQALASARQRAEELMQWQQEMGTCRRNASLRGQAFRKGNIPLPDKMSMIERSAQTTGNLCRRWLSKFGIVQGLHNGRERAQMNALYGLGSPHDERTAVEADAVGKNGEQSDENEFKEVDPP